MPRKVESGVFSWLFVDVIHEGQEESGGLGFFCLGNPVERVIYNGKASVHPLFAEKTVRSS